MLALPVLNVFRSRDFYCCRAVGERIPTHDRSPKIGLILIELNETTVRHIHMPGHVQLCVIRRLGPKCYLADALPCCTCDQFIATRRSLDGVSNWLRSNKLTISHGCDFRTVLCINVEFDSK